MKRILCLAALLVAAPSLHAQGARLGVMLAAPDEGDGAQIVEVIQPSAASVMGLQTGDVVLAIEGRKVGSVDALVQAVQRTRPGQIFELTLRRSGKVHTKVGVMGLASEDVGPPPEMLEHLGALGYIQEAPMEGIIEELEMGEEVISEHIEEIVEEPLEDVSLGEVPGVSWHSSLEQARRAAKRSGKPVLIDFYADWCGPCKALGREVLHNQKYDSLLSGFEAVQVNVDENPGLAKEYGVRGIPDVRILDSNGRQREDLSFVGYSGAEATVAKLKQALGSGRDAKVAQLEQKRRQQDEIAKDRAVLAQTRLESQALENQAAELQARMDAIQAELAAVRKQLEAMRRRGAGR